MSLLFLKMEKHPPGVSLPTRVYAKASAFLSIYSVLQSLFSVHVSDSQGLFFLYIFQTVKGYGYQYDNTGEYELEVRIDSKNRQ